jgi:hypothetical protein
MNDRIFRAITLDILEEIYEIMNFDVLDSIVYQKIFSVSSDTVRYDVVLNAAATVLSKQPNLAVEYLNKIKQDPMVNEDLILDITLKIAELLL